jgi:hypothetical protein
MTYLAYNSVVEAERSIDHIGSEKIPIRIVQQWGILVNGLTAEPATWRNVWLRPTIFV